jgi:hypothetical protein
VEKRPPLAYRATLLFGIFSGKPRGGPGKRDFWKGFFVKKVTFFRIFDDISGFLDAKSNGLRDFFGVFEKSKERR